MINDLWAKVDNVTGYFAQNVLEDGRLWADRVVDFVLDLPNKDCVIGMSYKTLVDIRKLKDGTGRYLVVFDGGNIYLLGCEVQCSNGLEYGQLMVLQTKSKTRKKDRVGEWWICLFCGTGNSLGSCSTCGAPQGRSTGPERNDDR